GGAAVQASLSGSPPMWTGSTGWSTTDVPAAGADHSLTVRSASVVGPKAEVVFKFRAFDRTPPRVTEFLPQSGAQLAGAASGAPLPVPVRIAASDVDGDNLTSGVAGARCRVDGGAWIDATRTTDPTYPWLAAVAVPARGPHTLEVDCVDAAGNRSASVVHTVLVVLPADIPDTTERTYLSDLLEFAMRRVTTGAGGSATQAM